MFFIHTSIYRTWTGGVKSGIIRAFIMAYKGEESTARRQNCPDVLEERRVVRHSEWEKRIKERLSSK